MALALGLERLRGPGLDSTFRRPSEVLEKRPMAALFAFLHHLAAFTLAGAIAVQFVLIRGELSAESARRLSAADAVVGASALVVLLIGLLRVFYFEKGASYYFHSVPFILKLSVFAMVALASIYPTVLFASWRKAMKSGPLPAVAPGKLRAVRRIIHWELAGVVVILLCAALMARGIGHFGG
jgi:putative membrane protein